VPEHRGETVIEWRRHRLRCRLQSEYAVGSQVTWAISQGQIVLLDANQKATPVPRHALLVSENPSSAAPRRMVTAADGTAEIHLKPGNYTIESDEALVFQGLFSLRTHPRPENHDAHLTMPNFVNPRTGRPQRRPSRC